MRSQQHAQLDRIVLQTLRMALSAAVLTKDLVHKAFSRVASIRTAIRKQKSTLMFLLAVVAMFAIKTSLTEASFSMAAARHPR